MKSYSAHCRNPDCRWVGRTHTTRRDADLDGAGHELMAPPDDNLEEHHPHRSGGVDMSNQFRRAMATRDAIRRQRAKEVGTCAVCDGDGYLDESTLSKPVYCHCEAGRRAAERDSGGTS